MIVVAVAAVAGLAMRVWILSTPLGALDSDEAISGLLALHMLDGDFSALYWLSPYGGTLEPAIAAAVFAIFGSSVIALKLATLGVFAAAAALTWRIGIRTVGASAALVGASLFWVFPAFFVWWTTKARGYYAVGLLLGLVVVLLALRLRERESRRDAALLGLALGLGWWTSPGVLILAVPALVWLLWRRPSVVRLVPIALPGFVIGIAPWLAWNLRNSWLSLDLSPVASEQSTFVDRVVNLFHYVLPTWLGLRVPFSLDWLLGPVVGWIGLGAAIAGFGLLVARRRPGLEPLLLATAMFPLLYGLSKFTYYVEEPRYVVYLSPVLALLAGSAFATPARAAAALGVALALSVAGLVQLDREEQFQPVAQDVRVPSDLGPVLDLLEREGQTRVLANYWLAYRLSFESDERVIATSTGFVRYQPHDRLVRRSDHPARVFVRGSKVEARARPGLVARGYRRLETGAFVVYVYDSA